MNSVKQCCFFELIGKSCGAGFQPAGALAGWKAAASLFVLLLNPILASTSMAPIQTLLTLTQEQASAFARLALKGIQKEYPNKPGEVLNGAADVKSPRSMHPAFYGCFDWHSS